jgi:hypothetical protein
MMHFLPLTPHIRDAIIAGSTGRMAMILLIYIGPFIGLPRIDPVSVLGSVAAPSKEAAVTLGGAIHFSVGVLFALVYAALWSAGIGRPTWSWGLIFGAVHGLLVIALLVVGAVRMYPQTSPYLRQGRVLIAIVLSHILYGIIVAVVYAS